MVTLDMQVGASRTNKAQVLMKGAQTKADVFLISVAGYARKNIR